MMKIPYSNLRDLLRHELLLGEHGPTERLIKSMSRVKRDKRMSREQFLEICKWKSDRPIRWCEKNSSKEIQRAIEGVLETRSERSRLEILTGLWGVSIPTASAILMMVDPRRYGVIDIRVWQLLYALEEVRTKADGRGFSFENWYQYLRKLRYFAKEFRVPARRIERSLFEYHRRNQRGRLYRSRGKR